MTKIDLTPIETEARALRAEVDRLRAERDEALRRRDAWKARAANHVQMVNALRAKTAGQDSRTLGRAIVGAAKMELEADNERLREQLRQAQQAQRNTRDAALEEAALCVEAWREREADWLIRACNERQRQAVSHAASIRALKTPMERARIARSGE
jgi:hypothetical protein